METEKLKPLIMPIYDNELTKIFERNNLRFFRHVLNNHNLIYNILSNFINHEDLITIHDKNIMLFSILKQNLLRGKNIDNVINIVYKDLNICKKCKGYGFTTINKLEAGMANCPKCFGFGFKIYSCKVCGGTKLSDHKQYMSSDGIIKYTKRKCRYCSGKGYYISREKKCVLCGGKKKMFVFKVTPELIRCYLCLDCQGKGFI